MINFFASWCAPCKAEGAAFTDATITPISRPACTNGKGLVGSYTIRFAFVATLTVTAKSCYPTVT